MTWSEWIFIPIPMKNIAIPVMAVGWVRYAAPSLKSVGGNTNRLVPIRNPLMTLKTIPIVIMAIGMLLLPFIIRGKTNERWK